jgi:hypothetical protein
MKRGKEGPRICILCFNDEELVDHLFASYRVSKLIWNSLKRVLHFPCSWGNLSLDQSLFSWQSKALSFKNLPTFVCWNMENAK